MNKFNIYFFLFLFCCLASCINDKKIDIKKNTEVEKKALRIDYEDTLSTEIKSINKIDTSRRIPEDRIYLKDSEFDDDYHGEVLAHLKRNIGKAYSRETYIRFIDSNKTELHKLIREYHQKIKMTLDTNQ